MHILLVSFGCSGVPLCLCLQFNRTRSWHCLIKQACNQLATRITFLFTTRYAAAKTQRLTQNFDKCSATRSCNAVDAEDLSFFLTHRCFLLHQPGSDGGQPVGDGVHHQHPVQLRRVQRGASLAQRAGTAVHRCRGLSPSKKEERQGHSLPQPVHQRYRTSAVVSSSSSISIYIQHIFQFSSTLLYTFKYSSD